MDGYDLPPPPPGVPPVSEESLSEEQETVQPATAPGAPVLDQAPGVPVLDQAPGAGDPDAVIDLETPIETDQAPPALPPFGVAPGEARIEDFLRYIVEVEASDLHTKAGSPPTIRHSGNLEPLEDRVLDADEVSRYAHAMMQDKEVAILKDDGEVDFAYSLPGVGRFRVNVHRQRGSLGIAVRRILPGAPDFDELGLPSVVERLAASHRGLLLVTGPTSSGKTTTCGAIIKHINKIRRCHIVTIEDPIEILHKDELSVVTQREIGQDTMGFLPALRAAMRQDPDVIFVGEIRDTETVSAALQAAETGHFVLATMHTTNVSETITRVIDFFPAHQQNQTRVALAGSLAGVITQRLIPKTGGGRCAALEIMVMNGRIRDCVLDPDKTHDMHDVVADSGFYGMQTFDQALVSLFRAGVVSLEDARAAATVPQDFELKLRQEGLLP